MSKRNASNTLQLITKAITEFVAVSKAQNARISIIADRVNVLSAKQGLDPIDTTSVHALMRELQNVQQLNDKAATAMPMPGKVQ